MSEGEVRSRLAEAGWESVVFEGSSYWRSPETGRRSPPTTCLGGPRRLGGPRWRRKGRREAMMREREGAACR